MCAKRIPYLAAHMIPICVCVLLGILGHAKSMQSARSCMHTVIRSVTTF